MMVTVVLAGILLAQTPAQPGARVVPGAFRTTAATLARAGRVGVVEAQDPDARLIPPIPDAPEVRVPPPVPRILEGRIDAGSGIILPRLRLSLVSSTGAARVLGVLPSLRPDGSFTAAIPEGEYRASPVDFPENYKLRSFTYGSVDLLKEPLKVSGSNLERLHIVLDLVSAGSHVKISGRVVGAANLGPAGPFAPTGLGRIVLTGAGLSRAIESDLNSEGGFQFSDIPSGTYILQALPRPGILGGVSIFSNTQRPELMTLPGSEQRSLTVTDKDVSGIELVVPATRTVVGRIRMEDGLAVPASFLLTLTNSNGTLSTSILPRDGGVFSAVLPEGEYRLVFEGFPAVYGVRSVRRGAVDLIREPLKVGEQNVTDEIVITLAQAER